MLVYKWKMPSLFAEDANVVGKELKALADEGNLSPKTVLGIARDEDNPLHKLFEWDDSVAAEKYRLSQARQIIQQIVIVNDNPEAPETKEIRAFVTESTNNGHYQLITTVIEDQNKYDMLLAKAKNDLQIFKTKYQDLLEFKELFDEIEKYL